MDAGFWDEVYSTSDYTYGTEPNAFLVAQGSRLRPGMRVLVVGDGEGRNGVWLAGQGLDVTAVEQSGAGLGKARRLAAERGTSVDWIQADLRQWGWPEGTFDAVVAIFVHFPPEDRPRLHRAMLEALRPGGLLLIECFHRDQLAFASGGPPVADMLCDQRQLRAELGPGAERLYMEETIERLAEGPRHSGLAAVLRLVARRGGGMERDSIK